MKKLLLVFSVISLVGCGGGGSSTPAVNYGAAPVLDSISAQSTNEDTAKAVTLVGTDAESNPLTYSATSSTSNVVISVSGAILTLTPASNWNGTATITAKVNDGATDSEVQAFTLTVSAVNDAPTLSSIYNAMTPLNTAKVVTLVGADVDTEDTLTYSATSSTGDVTVSVSGASLTLTPATDWSGTVTITAKVNDGTVDSTAQTFSLTAGAGIPLLVVRVAFTDATFVSSETTWATKIFGTGTGQLNEYMSEISDGSYQFVAANETDGTVNDGIVTATLSVVHPNPIKEQILTEQIAALTLIDSAVDFAAYDTDGNTYITGDELSIMFLFAGQESATNGGSSGVWGHASGYASDARPVFDGMSMVSYSRFGERHDGTPDPDWDATIGIIAHELGHEVFQLPDLYDGTVTAGIGSFGMMSGGSWGYKAGEKQGETPVHPTGWAKIKMGFINPTDITADGTYTSNDIDSASNNVFKIASGRDGEYFLIENRNYTGYDRALDTLAGDGTFAGGLLITHIDDNIRTVWYVGNHSGNKLVKVEEANNAMLVTTCCGHFNNLFFDGNSGTFNDASTPNSKRNDGVASNVAITAVGVQGPAINFTVDVP